MMIPDSLVKRLEGLGPHFIRMSKRGKEPIDKGWPSNPMSASDPKLQAWLKEGGNYGVIGGFGLVIVDVDLKELKAIVKDKLPETFTVQSPGSKGWHCYYIASIEKPIRLRDKEGENVGDIQGQGKCVVGPGSIHPNNGAYKIIVDKPLAQVTREELIEAFKEFVVPDREIERVEATARLEKKESNIDIAIEQVVPLSGLHKRGNEYWGSHPIHGSEKTGRNFWVNPSKNCWHCFRHGSGGGPLLWLAVEEGIIECGEAQPGILRKEVFIKVLEKAKERGLIKDVKIKKAKGKRKPKPIRKASGISDLGPFEAIFHNGKPMFLVKNDRGFEIFESVTNNGREVEPKQLNEIPYESYGYKQGKIPTREELYWRVRDEFEWFLDCESEHKDMLAAMVLLSYQQEKLSTVPYVWAYGDNESGKTVLLSILKKLCYRPMYGVTIPAADLYGYLDDSDCIGTILEDEAQGLDKDYDKTKIYKAGYKQGAVVPRYIVGPGLRYIKFYNCFCFKAVASEKLPNVKGLVERFLFVPMVEGYPQKDFADLNQEDKKRLRKLRNDLLKWRLVSRTEWQIPEVELPVRGRLKELWKPIVQIVHGLPIEQALMDRIESLSKARIEERQSTLEGHIVKVVCELYEGKEQPIEFTKIWASLMTDLSGTEDEKKPYIFYTSELENDRVSKNKVGYRLREILDGKKTTKRVGDTTTWAYRFDEEKLKRIAKKYGYVLYSKLASVASSRGVSTPKKPLENNGKTSVNTPQKLTKLANSLYKIDIQSVLSVPALDPVSHGNCPICKKRDVSLVWQVLFIDGTRYDAVCMDCGGYLREERRKRDQA